MPSEADLTLKIRKALEKEGCYVAKIHGNRYSVGIPDLLVCKDGKFIGIEVKLPNRKSRVSPLQAANLDRIIRAGGLAAVVTSVKGALECLEELKE